MLMTVRFGRCIGRENQRGENAKHQQDAFNHSSQHYRMILDYRSTKGFDHADLRFPLYSKGCPKPGKIKM